jgi:hypothetical protein
MPEKGAIMYLFVRGIYFASFYDFLLDSGIVPTEWYYLFFLIIFIRFQYSNAPFIIVVLLLIVCGLLKL